jgi:hypothetical protein
MKMYRVCALVCGVLAVPASVACAQRTQKPADYCVVVNAEGGDFAEMAKTMDAYAKTSGYSIDISPTTHEYSSNDGGMSINVDAMGPVGVVVSMFARDSIAAPEIKRLSSFIEKNVSPRWGVRQCRDVPGFKTPQRVDTVDRTGG